uniref:Uncharacterized protein n=1 Tax=Anguilla anguilla TaxID=7936 RepID=A0A0E9UDS7_ANGAN
MFWLFVDFFVLPVNILDFYKVLLKLPFLVARTCPGTFNSR